MLDIKLIRKDPDTVKNLLARRSPQLVETIDELLAIDEEYRKALQEKQELEAQRNKLSKEVGMYKGKLGKASEEEKTELNAKADKVLAELNEIKNHLSAIAEQEPILAEKQRAILISTPNLPDPQTPEGKNEDENEEILKWGEPRKFDFEPREHDELGEKLGVFDFERGVKLACSRFTLVRDLGAKLERALMNFMLDQASANGYTEISPPVIVNNDSLFGTGQLPKFAEDVFKIEGEELYLIPTAEVPLTNIFRDEILSAEDLPQYFAAFTPCFRSEAGSAGKDTRGIIRQHQFTKVELVKLCKPEDSAEEHEKLTNNAEAILQALNLPYRKVLLCTGDMGFGAQKCYDLEVWFPGQGKYREISSCSNFGDFQARRAQIRFKREAESKAEFVHTINGSGLAIGRTIAAILENYQNEDGSVSIPEALQPYLASPKCI